MPFHAAFQPPLMPLSPLPFRYAMPLTLILMTAAAMRFYGFIILRHLCHY